MRHSVRLAGFALLLSAACTGGSSRSPDVPGGGAGTRLAIEVLTGPDGFEEAWGFYDTSRGESCGFRPAGDVAWRCMPSRPANMPFEGVLFADPDCNPGSRLVTATTGATLALVADQATCPTRWHVHQIGNLAPSSAFIYARLTPSGGCVAVTAPSSSLFRLGAEVDPSAFELATERLVPSAGATAQPLELVAEDGAWVQAGWRSASGDRCLGALDASGTWRCIPVNGLLYSLGFADGACTTPAATTTAPLAGCAPTVATAGAATGCGDRATFHEVGAAVAAPFLQAGVGAGAPICYAANGSFVRQPFWILGPELAPTSYPDGLAATLGAGRLRLESADFGGGPRIAGHILDTQLGIRCEPDTLEAEGVLRCLPTDGSLAWISPELFADAGCTQKLAWTQGCEEAVAVEAGGPWMVNGVLGARLFYRLGAVHTGPIYAWSTGLPPATCVERSVGLPPGTPHLLGPGLGYGAFAPLTIERRRR